MACFDNSWQQGRDTMTPEYLKFWMLWGGVGGSLVLQLVLNWLADDNTIYQLLQQYRVLFVETNICWYKLCRISTLKQGSLYSWILNHYPSIFITIVMTEKRQGCKGVFVCLVELQGPIYCCFKWFNCKYEKMREAVKVDSFLYKLLYTKGFCPPAGETRTTSNIIIVSIISFKSCDTDLVFTASSTLFYYYNIHWCWFRDSTYLLRIRTKTEYL